MLIVPITACLYEILRNRTTCDAFCSAAQFVMHLSLCFVNKMSFCLIGTKAKPTTVCLSLSHQMFVNPELVIVSVSASVRMNSDYLKIMQLQESEEIKMKKLAEFIRWKINPDKFAHACVVRSHI